MVSKRLSVEEVWRSAAGLITIAPLLSWHYAGKLLQYLTGSGNSTDLVIYRVKTELDVLIYMSKLRFFA